MISNQGVGAILVHTSILLAEERRRIMYPVEIRIRERDEDALTARMTAMREWLDHHRFEPAKFRYTFEAPGIVYRVDFSDEAPAVAFAKEFGGRLIADSDKTLQQAAGSSVAAD
jgi:hypothetical protein